MPINFLSDIFCVKASVDGPKLAVTNPGSMVSESFVYIAHPEFPGVASVL